MHSAIRIAPSILAADRLHLYEEVEKAVRCGADELHVDIMDGHFVPNLSYGPDLVKALRRAFPEVWLDVHLMVSDPARWIGPFAEAGATGLTVHREAIPSAEILADIQRLGAKPGISLKPATPVSALTDCLPLAERVLIMTACDGGVTLDNAPQLAALGADTLIMGTAFFRAPEPGKVAEAVHAL